MRGLLSKIGNPSPSKGLCGKALMVIGLLPSMVYAVPTPPDLSVCNNLTCETLSNKVCSDAGFSISLKSYTPATTQSSGAATYVYEICSPSLGTCSSLIRPGEPCLDNSFCRSKGQLSDINAYCSRECSTDTFRGLSHFDATFPGLGASTCLSSRTAVSGSCSAVDKNNNGIFPTVGSFVRGDASCFDADSSGYTAKCDNTSMEPGDCIEMTLTIAGETTGLGRGTSIVVDKEATACTATCIGGPSCDSCDPEDPGPNFCLTRTLGFWGTHPWITNDFANKVSPMTVCGNTLLCGGPDDGLSNPSCSAGSCSSIMEGLGSNPGTELPINPPYVTLVKQITAAKLNIKASQALAEPGSNICTDWSYGGKDIYQWLTMCEGSACSGTKSQISTSGCIEALDAFNNHEDSGFEQTPGAFARPSLDDRGNISGADSNEFTRAQGKNTPPGKLVIGKYVSGGTDCR